MHIINKIGLLLLAVGILTLCVGVVLTIIVDSIAVPITLGASILINSVGLTLARHNRQGRRRD